MRVLLATALCLVVGCATMTVNRTGHAFEVYCEKGWVYFVDVTVNEILARERVDDCGTWRQR